MVPLENLHIPNLGARALHTFLFSHSRKTVTPSHHTGNLAFFRTQKERSGSTRKLYMHWLNNMLQRFFCYTKYSWLSEPATIHPKCQHNSTGKSEKHIQVPSSIVSAAYPQHDEYSCVVCFLQCLLLLDFIGKTSKQKNYIYNSKWRENQQVCTGLVGVCYRQTRGKSGQRHPLDTMAVLLAGCLYDFQASGFCTEYFLHWIFSALCAWALGMIFSLGRNGSAVR